MSDIVFSLEAAKQGKFIGLMPKAENWIKPQHVKECIYTAEVNGPQSKQIELTNQIWQRLQ
jgi:hypothetical protein